MIEKVGRGSGAVRTPGISSPANYHLGSEKKSQTRQKRTETESCVRRRALSREGGIFSAFKTCHPPGRGPRVRRL